MTAATHVIRLAVALTLALVAGLAAYASFPAADKPASAEERAEQASDRFLDTYMDAEGRVARLDQGGDTVSEGQAYAMLLAAATGDLGRFELAWSWTREHLQRPDGLLAWSWRDGQITSNEPAADADIDAARALLVAARRFGVRRYAVAGRAMANAVLDRETVSDPSTTMLVAGPWARTERDVNPSYFSPRAYAELASSSRGAEWRAVATSSRSMTAELLHSKTALPPDWARGGPGWIEASGPPDQTLDPAYSYDAARLPVRFAESCDARDRRLAARPWRFLERIPPEQIAPVYSLDGTPSAPGQHPAALTGAAGAAWAAGDRGRALKLLDRAERVDASAPTYYGAAWVALGRVMLTTHLLGSCGAPRSDRGRT